MINEVSIETHYAHHRYFIEEDELLSRSNEVPTVPTILVHGRRDLTCPLESSWLLHRALPHSELRILSEAGHLANEPSMIDALVTATDQIAKMLS